MNQIPNIEEEPLPSIDELLKRYFDTPAGCAAEYVDIADIRSLIYRAREEEKQTLTHQLQKARHDWLREEIVRLEGVEDNKLYGFPVIVSDDPHPSEDYKEGFLIGFNLACTKIIDRYKTELNNNKV